MNKLLRIIIIPFFCFPLITLNAQWVKTSLAERVQTFTMRGNDLYTLYSEYFCHSSDNGNSWRMSELQRSDVTYYPHTYGIGFGIGFVGNTVFASNGRGIWKSQDLGYSWDEVTYPGMGTPGTTRHAIASDCFTVNGSSIYIGVLGGIRISHNGGVDWISSSTITTPPSGQMADWVRGVVVDSTIIFVGCGFGGVLRSTDFGKTWNATSLQNTYVICLYINNSILYAGTIEGLFVSMNYGINWKRLGQEYFKDVYYMAFSDSNIFLVSQKDWVGNIYLSTNLGLSWEKIDHGFEGTIGAIYASDTFLFVSAFANGNWSVWRCSLAETITDVNGKNNQVPNNLALEQNYPNPFNPTTTISYSLPQTAFVTLKVFDGLGREVTTLVSENKLPGNYEVKFNGTKLSSGVYFYRMQFGNSVISKKMLLVR